MSERRIQTAVKKKKHTHTHRPHRSVIRGAKNAKHDEWEKNENTNINDKYYVLTFEAEILAICI